MPAEIPDDINDALETHCADDEKTFLDFVAFITTRETQPDAECHLKQLRRYLDKPALFKGYVIRIAKKADEPENQPKVKELYDNLEQDLKEDPNALAKLIQNKPLLETKRNYGFYYALSRFSPGMQTKVLPLVVRNAKSMQIVALASATQISPYQQAGKVCAVLIALGPFGKQFYQNIKKWRNNEISGKRCAKNILDDAGELIGNLFGGSVGATSGAYAGAMFGPIGVVVGGLAGGYLGSVMGADMFRNWFEKKTEGMLSCPADIAVERAYDFFGLSPTCSNADINKRYKELALQYHPDKRGDKDKFVELQTHHAILKAERDC